MATSLEQIREIANLFLRPDDPTPIKLRQGIVAGIGMGRVDVLLDGLFSIGGIPFLSSYNPRVGDTVWLIKHGSDMFIIGNVVEGGVELENWHFVNQTEYDEPPFQNSWVNYSVSDPQYEEASFYKDVDGWVHLRGLIRNLTGAAYDSVMFTLPVGYRPATTKRIPIIRGGNSIWLIEIRSDGTVRHTNATTTAPLEAELKAYVSFAGVRFEAAPAVEYDNDHTWTPFAVAKDNWGWDTSTTRGTPYEYPAQWHRWDGLVRCRGQFVNGTGSHLAIMSERSSRTRWSKLFPTVTYTDFNTIEPMRMDVYPHYRLIRSFEWHDSWDSGLSVNGLQWLADVPEGYWTDFSYVNGWEQYSINNPTWGPASFYRDGYNEVHLKGLIKNPGTRTINTAICILPEDHRPSKRLVFATDTDTGFGRVDVLNNGEVRYMTGGGSGYFSLDSISFRAA